MTSHWPRATAPGACGCSAANSFEISPSPSKSAANSGAAGASRVTMSSRRRRRERRPSRHQSDAPAGAAPDAYPGRARRARRERARTSPNGHRDGRRGRLVSGRVWSRPWSALGPPGGAADAPVPLVEEAARGRRRGLRAERHPVEEEPHRHHPTLSVAFARMATVPFTVVPPAGAVIATTGLVVSPRPDRHDDRRRGGRVTGGVGGTSRSARGCRSRPRSCSSSTCSSSRSSGRSWCPARRRRAGTAPRSRRRRRSRWP